MKSRYSQPLDKERAAATDPAIIQRWFTLINDVIKEYQIKAGDTYNMDEKGYALGIGGKAKVVVGSHDFNAYMTQSGSREWATIIECISANGRILKNWIIFKGKRR